MARAEVLTRELSTRASRVRNVVAVAALVTVTLPPAYSSRTVLNTRAGSLRNETDDGPNTVTESTSAGSSLMERVDVRLVELLRSYHSR